MPSKRSVLIAGLLLAFIPVAGQQPADLRLLFTGDILLSRQVLREMQLTGRSPWTPFASLFRSAALVSGNLEGAVGEEKDCISGPPESPCFAVPAATIPLLAKAGFRVIGMANNHSSDLGQAGLASTRDALRTSSLDALSFDNSPLFETVGGHTLALVALSAVPGRDGTRIEIPSTAVRQKLQLARTLSELVVVYVHWGTELLDWPNNRQREAASWLIQNGADLIVGHHPHVVQPAECILGKPVFFSLGNHVFDQKYPETKKGLIADCRIHAGSLACAGIATIAPSGSAMPQPGPGGQNGAAALHLCPVPLHSPATRSGIALRGHSLSDQENGETYVIEGSAPGIHPWRSKALPLLFAEVGRLAGPDSPDYLFALEKYASPIDHEDGVRPYVYEALPKGLVARWRGSALAWPLLDAALLPGTDGVICALHRRDSFIALQPDSTGTRTAAYHWNGFGFSGIDDPQTLARCKEFFGSNE
jgi:poly-gamma-glutamate synthesis protein (capsule biosynthesis protein)